MTEEEENRIINIFRKSQGVSEIKIKNRKCLRCDEEFKSKSKNNRVCGKCKDYNGKQRFGE